MNKELDEGQATLLLLEIRNAIADKEWVIACADMETACSGKWTCDWYKPFGEADGRVDELLAKLK